MTSRTQQPLIQKGIDPPLQFCSGGIEIGSATAAWCGHGFADPQLDRDQARQGVPRPQCTVAVEDGDGQQRCTTLMLMLCALRDTATVSYTHLTLPTSPKV